MKRAILTLIMLLSCNIMFSQHEFEYIYAGLNMHDISEVISFSDVFEMDNGDFMLFDEKLSGMYFGRFSNSGELLSETVIPYRIPGYNSVTNEGFQIIKDDNNDFYTFLEYNPIFDTTNANYQGYFDSKIVMNKFNENLDLLYSEELTIPLDTTNWLDFWAVPQSLYYSAPEIKIGTVLDEGNGFLICYEKYAGEKTGPDAVHTHGFDSTFFNMSLDRYRYFIIRMIDADMQVLNELYYDLGETSCIWVTSLKATNDGSCMIAGHFRDFGIDPNEHIHYNVIKKFSTGAFLDIEEAHVQGLKAAIAYPNPGNNTMSIQISLKNASVEVYDMLGKSFTRRTSQRTSPPFQPKHGNQEYISGKFAAKEKRPKAASG